MSNNRYWYKGHAVLYSGLPYIFEGGIPAESASAALSAVKAQSGMWNAKRIASLYIYKISKGGVIPSEPEIFLNVSGEALPPGDMSARKKVHMPMKKTGLREQFDDATWTYAFRMPEPFPTIVPKEKEQ